MKIFLDTANLAEIKEAHALGMLDGVTTNPSLMAREQGDEKEIVKAICDLVQGPVSVEVISTDEEGMLAEARKWAGFDQHVVVKVPLTEAGLKTVSALSPEGVKFNVTLCFNVVQGLLAAKAGAHYISPFVGRWDDIDTPGIELIPNLVTVFDNYGFDTEILVASIRSPLHVSEAAIAGADVATLPLAVLKKMIYHPLTEQGLAKFLADYEKSKQS